MKKIRLFVLGLMICALFVGCGTSSYDPRYDEDIDSIEPPEPVYSSLGEYIDANCDSDDLSDYLHKHYTDEELIEFFIGDDRVFDYLKDNYSEDEIVERCVADVFDYISERYSKEVIFDRLGINDSLEELDIFNFEMFVDDLQYNGDDDDMRALLRLFDTAGYYPDVVIGNYFADRNHVIHRTNSSCLDATPIDDIIFLSRYLTLGRVVAQIESEDSPISGYTICPDCISAAEAQNVTPDYSTPRLPDIDTSGSIDTDELPEW